MKEVMLIVQLFFAMVITCYWTRRASCVALETCTIMDTPDQQGGHADCSGHGLNQVPDIPMHKIKITTMDLSKNKILMLGPNVFKNFTELTLLNLSNSQIASIHEQTFVGLHMLTILDLTNNIVMESLSNNTFKDCISLKILLISGYVIQTSPFTPLKKLEEITLTPDMANMHYDLINLPHLHILNFVNTKMSNLSKEIIYPFSKGKIEEIAFHNSNLKVIESNTFDNFIHLRLLNFAQCYFLRVNDIIEVISSSKDINIETLIVDLVGKPIGTYMALPENTTCKQGWLNLKRISLRGVSLYGIDMSFANCFPNLEYFAAGFNSPITLGGHRHASYFLAQLFPSLKAIDISYLFSSRMSYEHINNYYRTLSWVPPNWSYFQHTPEIQCVSVPVHNVSMNHMIAKTGTSQNKCPFFNIPPCLTDIIGDHIAFDIDSKHINDCAVASPNNIRYINMSNWMISDELKYNFTLFGLTKLQILDFCQVNLAYFNFSNLQFMPSIQEAYFGRNKLGSNEILKVPNLMYLKVFDLSANLITKLASDTFENLPSLHILILHHNKLENVSFLTQNLKTLHLLDLRNNKLIYLTDNTTNTLESMFQNNANFEIDISGNPFACECDQINFMQWVQTTKIRIKYREDLYCQDTKEHMTLSSINIKHLMYECKHTMQKIILVSVSAGLLVVCLLTSIVAYNYRWSIKWTFYKLRYSLMKKNNAGSILLDNDTDDDMFGAFVIYPIEDDKYRAWVFNALRTQVEEKWQAKQLFLRGRNDMPGWPDVDNIVEGIMNSQIALWVVCPSFFEDSWCEVAAQFAFRHLRAKKNLLLVMETDLENYQIPKHFMNLLNKKLCTTRLFYTEDKDGQRLFWSQLRSYMPIS